ncbi:hypothetical protein FQR65_LT10651 [Abscondita terminalis]|nr:hypothetical protein FQR65_LT10651 [Abscondita terminalis]
MNVLTIKGNTMELQLTQQLTEVERELSKDRVASSKLSWLGWWSHFRKIHEDEFMSDAESEKLEYLSIAMKKGTEAKELVDSYPTDAKNCLNVVEALVESFGRKYLLLQVYAWELLQLVILNASGREKVPLSSLYLKLNTHLRSLEALELEKVNPKMFLFPLVESSISEKLYVLGNGVRYVKLMGQN